MKNFNGLPAALIIFLCMILLPFKTYALTDDTNIKIEKFIKENMDKGNIPGLFVTVVKDDKTVYEKGFGYSDVEKKERVTSKSLFEIGSNSKAFTALGILKLQKEGLIELNDEVTDYIPWLKVKYKGREVPVTIEQLLHHTSGIPFKTIDNIPVSNDDNAIDETVRTLIGIELDSEPGEKFQYATINYDVLGLIIEKATGSSYEEYIEENILKPMGLNNTYLYRDEDVSENMAKGYKIEFLKPALYDAPTYRGNKPAGYIMSNGEDMGKWLKIQMGTYNSSRFDRELIEESHNPNRKVPPLEDGSSYACGWYVYQKGGGEISHGGNNPNYSSFILLRPEDKTGIAVLGNTNSEYVGYIARGINGILQGEDYYEDVNDLNKNADMISVLLILISVLIIAGTLFFTVKALKEVFRKERFLNKKNSRDIFKFIFSLIFMIGLSYSIYLIPNILYRGVSWNFVFVWLPETVKTALYLVYISIWTVYVYSVFISLYKKEGDKSILILSILSVLSGFGNALIIFTINMAIRSGNDEKVKLLMYFILGIILYVYGQRIMRIRMIEITNGIVYSKRMEIVKGLLKTPYNKFEEIDKGRIQSTLNNDTETISRFVNIIISGVTSAITLICCFIYLGFINIYALLLSVIIILFIAGIYYLVGRYANRIGEEARDLQNIFFKFINDLIGGFKELSLNGKRKEEFQEDLEESCDRYKVKRGQSALAFANMFVVGELLFTIAIGAVVFILPLILKNLKEVSLESYVFILLYMTGPVHGILNAIPNAIEVRISLKRINGLLSQISSSDGKNNDSGINKKEDKIILKLKGIEYVYDKDGENSFKVGPIDYEFKSGEIFFITGGNGSGKSTLAKLLTGLYVPSKGYITLNGNRVLGRELSEKYSGIFSDFYLFDKLYGIDYKDKEEEIRKYLEILQLDNKVRIKEGKFDTIKLSTGQKKRLALLVAYLEDRPIYIFDEWAADQDPEFRLFFYDTILPELKERGKCVIAITHDDRYFNVADKIIKMDMGSFQTFK